MDKLGSLACFVVTVLAVVSLLAGGAQSACSPGWFSHASFGDICIKVVTSNYGDVYAWQQGEICANDTSSATPVKISTTTQNDFVTNVFVNETVNSCGWGKKRQTGSIAVAPACMCTTPFNGVYHDFTDNLIHYVADASESTFGAQTSNWATSKGGGNGVASATYPVSTHGCDGLWYAEASDYQTCCVVCEYDSANATTTKAKSFFALG